MIHPDTELRFISKKIGYGVVATKLIPKGTITWAMDKLDRVFDEKDIQRFGEDYQKILDTYCYRDSQGKFILCWDIARFVNHSFNSSCITTAYDFELAVRDIQPGEQLTDDYGYLNISEPFVCEKEEGSLRTRVMPDDLLHFHTEWDSKLKEAFQKYNQVEQPLMKFLSPELIAKTNLIGAGKMEMDSILNCYFHGNGVVK
ncbi:MAG: SET domain-containing protein [Bacteroidetes bacterium]|nr:SET domain-containing protein [Bacteroidota bacterium]